MSGSLGPNQARSFARFKWIKLLQTPHPLGFNGTISQGRNNLRLPDFEVFLLKLFVNAINVLMVYVIIGI